MAERHLRRVDAEGRLRAEMRPEERGMVMGIGGGARRVTLGEAPRDAPTEFEMTRDARDDTPKGRMFSPLSAS